MKEPLSEEELRGFIYHLLDRQSRFSTNPNTRLLLSIYFRDNAEWNKDDIRLRDYPPGKNLTVILTL